MNFSKNSFKKEFRRLVKNYSPRYLLQDRLKIRWSDSVFPYSKITVKLYEIKDWQNIYSCLQGYIYYIRSTLRTPKLNKEVIYIFHEIKFVIMIKYSLRETGKKQLIAN